MAATKSPSFSLIYHWIGFKVSEEIKHVRANCFCASLLRTQIHATSCVSVRALNNKMNIDRADGRFLQFCLDLTILDVRWLLLFFAETDCIYNNIHIVQKWRKNQWRKLKIIQDFYPRDIESCHPAAARRVKLWSLNTNLFIKELHQ